MTSLSIDTTTTVGTSTVRARFDATAGITALFGPSGSGKSVTLSTIAGLLRPVAGQVTIRGRLVADPTSGIHVPTQDRRIGMVFQQPALLAHRSPLDNVALGVRDAGTRADRRERARDLLATVHAGHLAAAPTGTLSGGEQQRVALARALAGRPDLLLLDEPFSALDQASRVILRELLQELVDRTATPAILVTHDLDDLAALADRIVLYEPGATVDVHDRARGDELAVAELGRAPR